MAGPVECKHCGETGTCKNGTGGNACAACFESHVMLDKQASPTGLWCAVCSGTGVAEPFSAKLQARIAPYVGLSIIIGILVMIVVIAVKEAPLRGQVLTLAGTLGGAVTGYYFGGKHSAP